MLPKNNRLKNKKEFKEVFKKGKGFEKDFLFLKIKKINSDKSKFGFIVSRKINKKAVARNKIKRRLREVVKGQISKIKPGINVVMVVKKDIKEKEFSEIKKTVTRLLKEAEILNE